MPLTGERQTPQGAQDAAEPPLLVMAGAPHSHLGDADSGVMILRLELRKEGNP